MTIEHEFILSFYKEISTINKDKQVFLVQHIETGQVYVKKTILAYNYDLYQLLKKNAFPFIPRIEELIIDDERLIVIEEFINGRNLQDFLDEKKFSEEEVKSIIFRLCDILQPLHNHVPEIIHRDIKPSNLMLDSIGQLYLIDFDAAKVFDPKKKRDTVLMGTAEYAAPEQYGFSQSSTKTDIYAIGILINELLTGKLPVNELYSGPLQAVIQKCTAIDPEKRFNSVIELRNSRGFVDEEPSNLPPGFRSDNLLVKFFSALGYILLIYVIMTTEFEDANGIEYSTGIQYLNRIMCTSMILLAIFYLGNMSGIRNIFPFRQRSNGLGNKLRIALGCFLLMMIPAGITVIIESILGIA
ncbi:serine/threonine protein kinase [Clostridiales Family XIII bacterium PM5-7]